MNGSEGINEVPEVTEAVDEEEVAPEDVTDLVENHEHGDFPDPWAESDVVQDPEAVDDAD